MDKTPEPADPTPLAPGRDPVRGRILWKTGILVALVGVAALAIALFIPRLMGRPRARLVIWIPQGIPARRLLPATAWAASDLDGHHIRRVRVSPEASARHFGELLAIRLGARIVWMHARHEPRTLRLACRGHGVWIVRRPPRLGRVAHPVRGEGIVLFGPRCAGELPASPRSRPRSVRPGSSPETS